MTIQLLLVEDDELDRQAIQRALRDADAEVTEVESLEHAYAALTQQRFDCVL